MKIPFTRTFLQFLIVLFFSLIVTGLLVWRTEKMSRQVYDGFGWDHHKYVQMAKDNPFDFHLAPFCWRVGTPLAAKCLPFALDTNFFVISFASIAVAGVIVYYLVLLLPGMNAVYAWTGLLLYFSLTWATRFVLYDYWLTDALGMLIITLLFYCLYARKDLFFFLLLAIGVTVKESIIFVAPLYYTLNAKKIFDGRLAGRTLLLAAPAAALILALRHGIPALNTDAQYVNSLPDVFRLCPKEAYRFGPVFHKIMALRAQVPFSTQLTAYTVGTFGLMATVLPLFALKRHAKLFLAFAPFVLLVYAQLLLASNTERLLVMAFPTVLIAALYGIESIEQKHKSAPYVALALAALLLLFRLYTFVTFSDKVL